ncbi:MAG: hypothetical protein JXB62_02615 [Pirellulales bacterium]|nr:hypothetical protein [Pirellulales bacterium]
MPTLKYYTRGRVVSRSLLVISVLASWIGLLMCGELPGQATPATPAGPPAAPAMADAGGTAEYVVDPIDRAQMRNREVPRILRGTGLAAADGATLDEHFTKYVLAEWSQPENIDNLTVYRNKLRNSLKSVRSDAVRTHLNALILAFMKDRAEKNYHPAVRINALLMIGELNSAYGGGRDQPDTPYAEAFPVLVGEFVSPTQTDAVKVASLVGILRHLRDGGGTAPGDRNTLATEAYQLVTSKTAPGRSAAGHAWMRALAAEALGELKVAGNNGSVITALAQMAAEQGIPFSARCAAAEALAKFNLRGAAGLDASSLTSALGRLAADACAAEKKAPSPSARRLKVCLHCAAAGLAAVAPLDSASVAKVQAVLKPLLDTFEDRRLSDDEIMKKVSEELPKLQRLLSS